MCIPENRLASVLVSPVGVCLCSFCKVASQGPIMVSSHFLYISTVMFSDRKALRSPFPIHLVHLPFIQPNFICANSRLLSLSPQHQHSRVYSQLRDSHFNGQIVCTLWRLPCWRHRSLGKSGMLTMQGCLLTGGNACFSPRSLGVDIVNDLVTCAVYRARPYPKPPEYLSRTLPP